MRFPRTSRALFTDFYELTMAQAYWQSGMTAAATFSFFVRNYPPDRGYLVFGGLADLLDYLESFRFLPDDIDYLRSLNRFDTKFLSFLGNVRFTGDVRAVPEGSIFFANEPVIEVTAPVIEAQLIETYLVNELNLQSLLATKAARVRTAARDRQLIDFAARRTHGVESANQFARLCYLVGFEATSNTQAGALYGIPVTGTMAHSFITCFAREIDAFRAYAASFPDTSTFLVDTYDTIAGTKNAIAVAKEMQRHSHRLRAIRLDSGDMAALAREARRLLDEAGLADVQIVASGGLDEFEVAALVSTGAPIDAYGVGTKVGVSADAPWTDSVYKLVEYDGQPVLKLSPKKQTLPGPKQVFRHRDSERRYLRDEIACAHETVPPGAEPLLAEVMKHGQRVQSDPSQQGLRDRFRNEFACLPERQKLLRSPPAFNVNVTSALEDLQRRIVAQTMRREAEPSNGSPKR